MDPEFLQLTREAVAALQLQAAGRPSWVEIAQVLINAVGVSCILWVLWSMGVDGKRRDREIDAMAAAFRKQGQALERQAEAMTQAVTQQGLALERRGEVLAELLRRSA